ncbi:MAG: aminoacetone oxidase family FAD-binding enzyme [Nitrospirae bacterium CG_4_10_14_3_um_filter_44_29]|nr:MAG: aminoacetone oxidase family FAD-binding enzyme [Nitrospirae bacterium CG02_land_8_20_14_3_00_44_33]PIW89438.1 MAG: aminoacetone oxidase family FAD-binding enzyme [Nitrospirae bacterium CG_4_8_14_3_um_filter_44_28]PIX87845.1 MAG: aminoacetone oxidase family FAD-binding enzyme [Nitrospirae bacterium CG_4_10_14_3_um_filter_44_29]PJA82311.1 MAG: aminoacetone oxidase family FAD-binding enzyme [Nitrospirae bacterium CG_4_9_14_3_um_filter_44_28]
MNTNVIIIGAGAAGLMCAISAGKRGRPVIILDHASKIGKKILVSGGGRCNFTNLNIQAENYISANPHFCKSALARFTPQDFIALVKKHRISYNEKEDGQMFCNGSSRHIVDMLLDECNSSGVEMRLNCEIKEITKNISFIVKTNSGAIESESLVVATGGLSYPNLGATDIGHHVAAQFGLRIIPPKPALVPFTFSRGDREKFGELSGVSLEAVVICGKHKFRGEMLFTHKGLSGPAILQASSYREDGEEILVNLLPGIDAHSIFLSNRQSKIEMKNMLSRYLPRRFAHTWCKFYLPSRPLCQYNDKELFDASHLLHEWIIKPAGTEGYRTAEVTAGGVDTDELSSKTMEAKKVQGLYFIGEVVDVTGHLGGYNLHWAWASGWAAGQYA